jgi:hypothetical protein
MTEPLTFHQAKLLVNSDPNFKVRPGSQELKQIVKLREQSGHTYLSKVVPSVPTKYEKMEQLIDPLHLQRIQIHKKEVSVTKHEFYSIKANKDKVDAHMAENSR